ncbi:hypothetical protein [Halorubrum sp. SD683]|nr:hypothetical protein [Halorubrum sp. SD683]
MTGAYTDEELRRLDDLGCRREAEALTDIRQLHFSDFSSRTRRRDR